MGLLMVYFYNALINKICINVINVYYCYTVTTLKTLKWANSVFSSI